MTQSFEPEYGRLFVSNGQVEYWADDVKKWSIKKKELAILGEHTTHEGPLQDDLFIDFIDHQGRVYAFPWECVDDKFRQSISALLGIEVTSGLVNRTDFACRVIWPEAWLELDLFRLQTPKVTSVKSLLGRIMGTQYIRLSDEIMSRMKIKSSRFVDWGD